MSLNSTVVDHHNDLDALGPTLDGAALQPGGTRYSLSGSLTAVLQLGSGCSEPTHFGDAPGRKFFTTTGVPLFQKLLCENSLCLCIWADFFVCRTWFISCNVAAWFLLPPSHAMLARTVKSHR